MRTNGRLLSSSITLLIELERLIDHNTYLREKLASFKPDDAKKQTDNLRSNGHELSHSSIQTGFEVPHFKAGSPIAEQQAIAFERLATLDRYLTRLQKQKMKTEEDPHYNTGGNFSSVMSNVSQYETKVCISSSRQNLQKLI